MKRKGTLDVAAWVQPVIAVVPNQQRKLGSVSPAWVGIAGTLLIHAVVLQSALLGTRAHKPQPPPSEGLGATSIQAAASPAESLVLIELTSSTASSQALFEEIASAGFAPKNPLVTIISTDPLPNIAIPPDELKDTSDSIAQVDSADPTARAVLFGRYTGQIDARIERIWRRPRSPVTAGAAARADSTHAGTDVIANDLFRCQVRIIQDARGSVQEVQLLSCNGSSAWQHSLIVAILAASPLPAPPNPTVFTRSLTMTFTGAPYSHASMVDEYEIASTQPDSRVAK